MGTPTLITRDDPQLKKAPLGTDSVVAVGRIDPDPAGDKIFNLDGRDVIVPAGRVALSKAPGAESSTFIQSEHLIYNESQVRAAHITPLPLTRSRFGDTCDVLTHISCAAWLSLYCALSLRIGASGAPALLGQDAVDVRSRV